ncbi:MAG: ABC transporter ATP-binding protein [Nitrospirota bacterium]|nr:ABC transporter ATP-binding protein [Nitrospirota bacterium]
MKNDALEVREVVKSYHLGKRTVQALRGVSLKVRQGERIAIMGPSGSGKSTLLHLLGGLDTPTQGEVFLEGRPVTAMSDTELTLFRRRRLGFVFQFFNLLPTLTAQENVALPLLLGGASLKAVQAKVDGLLEMVGLSERKRHRPDELSGGEMQRVAIARAFVNDPVVVLADEPTGNLDTKTGKEVLALFDGMARGTNKAIVLVTHDPKIASFAERVVRMEDGLVAQIETA